MEKEKQSSEIMREILLSIKPEHLVKILNSEKTLEIRKTMPKCELPCRVRLYCTKATNYYRVGHMIFNTNDLWYHPVKKTYICDDSCELMCLPDGYTYTKDNFLNRKVVGSFILNNVRCFEAQESAFDQNSICEIKGWYGKYLGKLQTSNLELLKESCLTSEQLEEYLQDKNGDIIDRKYFNNFLAPFRDNIQYITKIPSLSFTHEYIKIWYVEDFNPDYICLPNFKKNTMFKKLELDKQYTLDDLCLFKNKLITKEEFLSNKNYFLCCQNEQDYKRIINLLNMYSRDFRETNKISSMKEVNKKFAKRNNYQLAINPKMFVNLKNAVKDEEISIFYVDEIEW